MSNLEALLLGVVQGISEFLPISSSGHLVLVRYHLNLGDSLPLYVGIATNTGTLFAVLVVLRQVVWDTLIGVLASLRLMTMRQVLPRFASKGVALAYVDAEARELTGNTNSDAYGNTDNTDGDADDVALANEREQRRLQAFRLALLVIVGSLPTAVIGLTLEPFFERLGTPVPTSFALIVTGLVLWFVPKTGHKSDPRALTWRDALLVGTVQGLAVMPGISRAGITIGFLLWRGVSSDLAARLSFLLYLVVSFGVGLLGIGELANANVALLPLAIMTLTSFVAGYAALMGLFWVLKRGQLHRFAPYVWAVALLTLLRIALS